MGKLAKLPRYGESPPNGRYLLAFVPTLAIVFRALGCFIGRSSDQELRSALTPPAGPG